MKKLAKKQKCTELKVSRNKLINNGLNIMGFKRVKTFYLLFIFIKIVRIE